MYCNFAVYDVVIVGGLFNFIKYCLYFGKV